MESFLNLSTSFQNQTFSAQENFYSFVNLLIWFLSRSNLQISITKINFIIYNRKNYA